MNRHVADHGPRQKRGTSILGRFESGLAALVEGTFGRAFRSEIRPVELARRLAKEMDAHRTTSLQRTYVPNEFIVWLSARDRERYRGMEGAVIEELAAYLLEHARSEHLSLVAQPVIEFHTDEGLALGECVIEARAEPEVPSAAQAPAAPQQQSRRPETVEPYPAPAGNTMIFSQSERLNAPLQTRAARPAPSAYVVVDGKRHQVGSRGALLGRSRDCDVVLNAGEVSRRHAEILYSGGSWELRDLGSTNGVRINGRPVTGSQSLTDGDLIELGSVPLRFEVTAQ
jgi:hypothetical protein